MYFNSFSRVRTSFRRLIRGKSGNFGLVTALLMPVLVVSAGGSVDVVRAFNEKERLQGLIDGAVLAAATAQGNEAQLRTARAMMTRGIEEGQDGLAPQSIEDQISQGLKLSHNPDGSITGSFEGSVATAFLQLAGVQAFPIAVSATALATPGASAAPACIYVLGSKGQDVLINSGANLTSTACEVHVQSKASPAFIMNSGSTIKTAKFCVRGTNYIKNGGTLTNLHTGCAAEADPFAGKLTEPTVPSSCTTSGWKDGAVQVLKPGTHCETGFNGSPTITFEPGLHIIKGRMIINSNATVIAKGVTFYFPDTNSEIRINGGVTFTGTAPTSGPYKGILMFEKTSNAANNANKQQYVFNGSKGETLEGVIHLPNRDVTYNSTTNQTNQISLVVNSMIMNSANWKIEPYAGAPGATGALASVRLVK